MLLSNFWRVFMQVTPEELAIVRLFRDNVYGKRADTSLNNDRHSGGKGHWLEDQMGVAHNRNTAPDLFGYEMKDGTSSKISFGDWSPDYYIYRDPNYVTKQKGQRLVDVRDQYFLRVFGRPNPDKNGRHSWSGQPIPKIDRPSPFGCSLNIDSQNNILIVYNFSQDQRPDKTTVIPPNMQQENLVIATWSANVMRERVNTKFNQQGWFICKKDPSGTYNQIVFGAPLSFEAWIEMVKQGVVYFDSGMYEGNDRPYSQWRANNITFDNLIVRSYPPFPSSN